LRKPRCQVHARRPQIPGLVEISERPAEAADRALDPVLLLHLPNGYDAVAVRDAMIPAIHTLPAALKRSLTWDRGTELARHAEITLATDLAIYFCDPHSPWQRGSNENTNGLLRQYFPKGTDLAAHTAEHLGFVADQLNNRPRKP
jgi:IS30 family transposase